MVFFAFNKNLRKIYEFYASLTNTLSRATCSFTLKKFQTHVPCLILELG